MTNRELMQQALSTLEGWAGHGKWVWPESALEQAKRNTAEAIAALRERLAQPEQEPIAWVYPEGLEALKSGRPWTAYGSSGEGRIPFYLAPRQWQSLTDNEIALICGECAASAHQTDDLSYARAIEAKLKAKNL